MIVRYYLRGFLIGMIFEYLLRVSFEFLPLLIFIILVITVMLDIGADLRSKNWSPNFRITGRPLLFFKRFKRTKIH